MSSSIREMSIEECIAAPRNKHRNQKSKNNPRHACGLLEGFLGQLR